MIIHHPQTKLSSELIKAVTFSIRSPPKENDDNPPFPLIIVFLLHYVQYFFVHAGSAAFPHD
jgi:hypothetical protein